MTLSNISIYSVAPNTKDATLEDIIGDGSDFVEDMAISDEIMRMLDILNEKEREVIIQIYFKDKTQNEVGELLGLRQVSISRNLHAALRKLKTGNGRRKPKGRAVRRIDKNGAITVFENTNTARKLTGVARDTINKSCNYLHTTKTGDRWEYV